MCPSDIEDHGDHKADASTLTPVEASQDEASTGTTAPGGPADHTEGSAPSGPDTRERVGGYLVHEAASVFPLMEGDDFDRLVESIEKNGQRDAVEFEGEVLIEGRNRVRAVELLKARGLAIELRKAQWQPQPGQTVAEYVADKNLHRRHLTAAQRAQIAVDLVPMIERESAERQKATRIQPGQVRNPGGRNQHAVEGKEDPKTTPPSTKKVDARKKAANSTRGRVANRANTSNYAADQALKVKSVGSPKDIEDVKAGRKTPAEVLKKGESTSKKESAQKPIDHPFKPATPLQQDLLRGWVRLRDNKVEINALAQAIVDMRAILDAEEKDLKSRKKKAAPTTPAKGTAGRKKSAPGKEGSK